jgi:hypothetical protein
MKPTPREKCFYDKVHSLIKDVWGSKHTRPHEVAAALVCGALWVMSSVLGSNAEAVEWLKDFAENEPPPDEPRQIMH